MKGPTTVDAEDLALGTYLPLIVMAGAACFVYARRLITALRDGRDVTATQMQVGFGGIFALLGHLLEGLIYAPGRWFVDAPFLRDSIPALLLSKSVILIGITLVVAALFRRLKGCGAVAMLVALWTIGAVLSALIR